MVCSSLGDVALVRIASLSSGVRYYCCCCRRRYLLRRRDCAVSGSCRNKWPGPRRLWVSVSVLFYPGRKAIESGWLGMAWEPGPGWAVRCLYEEKLIDFFLSRNYQSHIKLPAVDRERRWGLAVMIAKRGVSVRSCCGCVHNCF